MASLVMNLKAEWNTALSEFSIEIEIAALPYITST